MKPVRTHSICQHSLVTGSKHSYVIFWCSYVTLSFSSLSFWPTIQAFLYKNLQKVGPAIAFLRTLSHMHKAINGSQATLRNFLMGTATNIPARHPSNTVIALIALINHRL